MYIHICIKSFTIFILWIASIYQFEDSTKVWYLKNHFRLTFFCFILFYYQATVIPSFGIRQKFTLFGNTFQKFTWLLLRRTSKLIKGQSFIIEMSRFEFFLSLVACTVIFSFSLFLYLLQSQPWSDSVLRN